jgi:hypothetical protein
VIEIELAQGARLRVSGAVDVVALRQVLACSWALNNSNSRSGVMEPMSRSKPRSALMSCSRRETTAASRPGGAIEELQRGRPKDGQLVHRADVLVSVVIRTWSLHSNLARAMVGRERVFHGNGPMLPDAVGAMLGLNVVCRHPVNILEDDVGRSRHGQPNATGLQVQIASRISGPPARGRG